MMSGKHCQGRPGVEIYGRDCRPNKNPSLGAHPQPSNKMPTVEFRKTKGFRRKRDEPSRWEVSFCGVIFPGIFLRM